MKNKTPLIDMIIAAIAFAAIMLVVSRPDGMAAQSPGGGDVDQEAEVEQDTDSAGDREEQDGDEVPGGDQDQEPEADAEEGDQDLEQEQEADGEAPPPECGNGKKETGEDCDFGRILNGMPGQTCSLRCKKKSPTCGDGVQDKEEECDWGNLMTAETQCTPECNFVQAVCGNGKKEIGEQCDDGNRLNNDGCSNNCRLPGCGDGYSDSRLKEECDKGDMNGKPGSGCTIDCKIDL